MHRRPLIALTADRRPAGPARPGPRLRPARPEVFVSEALVSALRAAGAEVIVLPPLAGDPASLAAALFGAPGRPGPVGGLLISGGAFDIHPRHYGQPVSARLDRTDEDRTALELGLAAAALRHDLPVLGVCGGMQVLAVAAGGALVQDIQTEDPAALDHEQPTDPARPAHPVIVEDDVCEAIFGARRLEVNSTHHQAVARGGPLTVAGWAPDGSVELVRVPGARFAVGVQWHPELLADAASARLFSALVEAARA